MSQVKPFLKNKGHENPRACVRRHAYVYACPNAYTSFMHAYVYTSMCMHARVPRIMKDKFFSLKNEDWNKSHIV